MRLLLVVPLLFLLGSCSDDSQGPEGFVGELDWEASFGGSGDESAQAVIQLSDGNLAINGFSNSTDGDISAKSTNVMDYWALKITENANIVFDNAIGGSDDDRGRDLVENSEGGLTLVGYSKSSDGDGSINKGQHDNWIVKTNASGNVVWERSYGFSGHDHAYSIINTADGGYLMGGFLDVGASGGEGNDIVIDGFENSDNNGRHGVGEYWIHKLDANGTMQWRRYFGGSNNDRIFDVVEANDGGYILCGWSESNDFDISNAKGSYDVWILKVSSSGALVWEKSFGGSGIEIGYSIISTGSGYMVAGTTVSNDGDISNNNGSTDAWLLNIGNNGDLLWEQTFGGSDFDAAYDIVAGDSGDYFIAGSSKSLDGDVSSNAGDLDYWVFQVDSNGELLWEQTFGGSGLDIANSLVRTTSNKLIVAGTSESNDGLVSTNKGLSDYWIISIR